MGIDTDKFLEKLGYRIYELRRAKGMSQKELSDLIYWDKPNLRKLEKGKRNATVGTLLTLCDALNITMKDLFDF